MSDEKCVQSNDTIPLASPEDKPIDDQAAADELLKRLAEEEILREAKQGAERAEIYGPSGWIKCPLPKPNKRFLHTTLRNAVSSNKYSHSPRQNNRRYYYNNTRRDSSDRSREKRTSESRKTSR